MPTALAISPHLDDAVFSAGGMLARLVHGGWRVVVATVFTASVPVPQGFALACQLDKGLTPDVDYMMVRRDEDAAACARIGAEPLWLPFAEAPHRGYHSAEQLFAGLHADDAIVDEITPAIADLVGSVSPDVVFAPQAIGAHVDHVAVYLALRACAVPLWLWADFPYFGRPTVRPSPFANDFKGRNERRIDLSPSEVDLKAVAAIAYLTQLGFQFGGRETAREAITSIGGTERYFAECDLTD